MGRGAEAAPEDLDQMRNRDGAQRGEFMHVPAIHGTFEYEIEWSERLLDERPVRPGGSYIETQRMYLKKHRPAEVAFCRRSTRCG